MKHEARPDWRHALLVASALVILAASHQAHGECVSPSAQAGATSTTVYRCPDADPEQAKQPALGTTEKTTVVERGSANLPWFEPKTTGNKGDADKLPAAKIIEPASAPGKPVETAKVGFTPRIAWLVAAQTAGANVVRTRRDGWVEIEVPASQTEAFVSWVLSFGPDARVFAPRAIRDHVVARLESLIPRGSRA